MNNNIKKIRELKNLTQYELAKKAGMTRRGILQIEKHKKDPRLSNAFKIAKSLDSNIYDVFELE